MSRTTQALLKLQQELAGLNTNAESEPAPVENVTIPAGQRQHPEEEDAADNESRGTERLLRPKTEKLAAIKPVEPEIKTTSTAVMSDVIGVKPPTPTDDAQSHAAEIEPTEETPPAESQPQSTMRFGLKPSADAEDSTDSESPASSLPTADSSAADASDADASEPVDEAANQELDEAVSTVNFGSGFRLPALSEELSRQLADLKQSGLINDPDELSQSGSNDEDETSEEAVADEDEIFPVELGATEAGPVDELDSEPTNDEQPKPTSEQQAPPLDQDDAPQDELALLQQAFLDAPLDAVTGSTGWPETDVDSSDADSGDVDSGDANLIDVETADDVESDDVASDDVSLEDIERDEASSEAAQEDVDPSDDPTLEPDVDKNGVRLYGPPPTDSTIYQPIEELSDFGRTPLSEADPLNNLRQLRSSLKAEHSPEDDNVFWQAKAKKRKAESATPLPATDRPVRNSDAFGESVVMHRRPAASTSFDQWLDKRLEDSAMRNALSEAADKVRELYTYAPNSSLLLASGTNSKQVYQPAAMTAIQLAEQTDSDVLLIDASLETRALSEKLAQKGAPGLTEALQAPKKWAASCHCWRRENLFFMPAGSAPVTSFSASGRAFVRLLDFLQPRYEFIVIDGGEIKDPFLPHIAKVCYGAMLVIRLAGTQMKEATASMQAFRSLGARVVGCLATNAAR